MTRQRCGHGVRMGAGDEGQALRGRRRMFVDLYLGECRGNATEAARRAGYRFPGQEGCRLLREPAVRAAIEGRLAELGVTRERVLGWLVEILEVDPAEFVEVVERGEHRDLRLRVEREAGGELRLGGRTRLLRSVNAGRYGVRIEVLDKVKALVLLGRYLRMWEGGEEGEESGLEELGRAIMESARKAAGG